jgi:hypothetical protein
MCLVFWINKKFLHSKKKKKDEALNYLRCQTMVDINPYTYMSYFVSIYNLY